MNKPATEYDLVIRHGSLIDGTGNPARPADIAIHGDRIAAVGNPALPAGSTAKQEIDASGLVVAPGFIDVHTHDDNAVLTTPLMEPKISQGVTTVVTGNCGISLAPLLPTGSPPPPLNLLGDENSYCFAHMADYLAAVRQARPNLNVAALVGHSTLRVGCMADLNRPASEAETEAMAERLDEGLAAGAIGLSSGLYYKTGVAADPQAGGSRRYLHHTYARRRRPYHGLAGRNREHCQSRRCAGGDFTS